MPAHPEIIQEQFFTLVESWQTKTSGIFHLENKDWERNAEEQNAELIRQNKRWNSHNRWDSYGTKMWFIGIKISAWHVWQSCSRDRWNCLHRTSPRSWNFPTLLRCVPSPRLYLLWCCEGNSMEWTSTFRLHLLPSAHLFHWSTISAESRSNYSHLLALLFWKWLYFKSAGISISKMCVFVFAILHLHFYILTINVTSDRKEDWRGLICFFGAGICVGGTFDTWSSLTITPNFINSS